MIIHRSVAQPPAVASAAFVHKLLPISQRDLLITIWVGTAFAVFFTVLRTWLQFRHNKRLYTNDVLICFAAMLHVALSITITCMVPVVYETLTMILPGSTFAALPRAPFVSYLRYQFAMLFLIWTALWTVKLAMLSFFWRLFTSVKTNAKLLWGCMCGITITTGIICLLLQALDSSPISRSSFNDSDFMSPKNFERFNRAFLFSSCVDIITDFLIMFIPFPLLWKLQMPCRQKHILIVIFFTPLTAITFAILRLVFQETQRVGPTINPIRLILYSTLEVSFSIIAACLPSLRLFFKERSAASSTAGAPNSQRYTQRLPRQGYEGAIVLKEVPDARPRSATNCSTEAILDPGGQERHLGAHLLDKKTSLAA